MTIANRNAHSQQHKIAQEAVSRMREIGYDPGQSRLTDGTYRARIDTYDGLVEGIQRYSVVLIIGEAAAESILIKNATVIDQTSDSLSEDSYVAVVIKAGEPPLILSGLSGSGSGSCDCLNQCFLISTT
jgi:hypothetical protein